MLTAFVAFLRTYAVWIYLLCAFGIVLGIKLLVDARRLSRTTLFSLEQERAGEQSMRAVILLVVSLLMIGAIGFVNLLVAPVVPTPESPIVRSPTTTPVAVIFPSSTPVATNTVLAPTKPNLPTPVPGTGIIATFTLTPTRPPPTRAPITTTPVYAFPAPVILEPPDGNVFGGFGQYNAAITFRWRCEPCPLGPNDKYEVVITFIDRTSGVSRSVAGTTQNTFLALKPIYENGGYEFYQKAKEDAYQWHVQVKRDPGNVPLSPPSGTRKFVWR